MLGANQTAMREGGEEEGGEDWTRTELLKSVARGASTGVLCKLACVACVLRSGGYARGADAGIARSPSFVVRVTRARCPRAVHVFDVGPLGCLVLVARVATGSRGARGSRVVE